MMRSGKKNPYLIVEGEWCGSGDAISQLIPDNFSPRAAVALAAAIGRADLAGSCGPVALVTESAPFFKGCKQHDRCYWTLGANRGECDNSFGRDLKHECEDTYKGLSALARPCCLLATEIYVAAVRGQGRDPYSEGQKEAREIIDRMMAIGYANENNAINLAAEFCLTNKKNDGSCKTDQVYNLIVDNVCKSGGDCPRLNSTTALPVIANYILNETR